MGRLKGGLRRLFGNDRFLDLLDRCEQQFAKVLAFLLFVVMLAAGLQLVVQVCLALLNPGTDWMGERLMVILGELLNLLIAVEVLQNITAYLRRHVVQVELVLLTAMTAVARKVIVMPTGEENKADLLAGLGVSILCLAGAYWLVRRVNLRPGIADRLPARRSPAIPKPNRHP